MAAGRWFVGSQGPWACPAGGGRTRVLDAGDEGRWTHHQRRRTCGPALQACKQLHGAVATAITSTNYQVAILRARAFRDALCSQFFRSPAWFLACLLARVVFRMRRSLLVRAAVAHRSSVAKKRKPASPSTNACVGARVAVCRHRPILSRTSRQPRQGADAHRCVAGQ